MKDTDSKPKRRGRPRKQLVGRQKLEDFKGIEKNMPQNVYLLMILDEHSKLHIASYENQQLRKEALALWKESKIMWVSGAVGDVCVTPLAVDVVDLKERWEVYE